MQVFLYSSAQAFFYFSSACAAASCEVACKAEGLAIRPDCWQTELLQAFGLCTHGVCSLSAQPSLCSFRQCHHQVLLDWLVSSPNPLSSLQDLTSWTRDGIAGLQSVVLYSLPELDGAIDTVPLGGLMGNNIFLVPERVKRLSARLRKWVTLRRTPTHVSAAS